MKLLPKANDNSFAGNSALIFLTRFFPTLANLAIAVWFSHQLDASQYGAYCNFWTRLILISTFATLGLQSFLVTYTPPTVAALVKRMKTKNYVWLIFWMLVVASVFAYVQYNEGEWLLPFSFLCIYATSIIIEALLMAFRNLSTIISVNLLHTIAFLWAHYIFMTEGFSLDVLFLYLLALATIKLGIYIIALIPNLSARYRQAADTVDMKSVSRLWFHMGVYEVSQNLFRWIDKFVIATLFSASVSAVYYNGAVDVPFLPLLLGAVGSAALMQLSVDKSIDAPVVMMNKSGRVLSSIVFPIFFFLVLFRYEFIETVFSAKYHDSVPIFLASILVLPFRAYNFTVVLQNKHEGRIINTGVVIDLLIACLLMYPLYRLLSFPGIAISFVISTIIQAGYYVYHTSRVLNVKWTELLPLQNWATKFIVFAFLFIGIHYAIATQFNQIQVLFLGALFTVIVSATSFIIELKNTRLKYGNATSSQT